MSDEQVFIIDSLERSRTAGLRAIKEIDPLLSDALDAIAAGRIEVAIEFIERSRNAAAKATEALRAK